MNGFSELEQGLLVALNASEATNQLKDVEALPLYVHAFDTINGLGVVRSAGRSMSGTSVAGRISYPYYPAQI
jgi:hypothetical protein